MHIQTIAPALLHVSMDNLYFQSFRPGRATKILFSDRNTFLALLRAIPKMSTHYSPIGSGPTLVHCTAITYLDTAMATRILHRSWPCKANNVRHGDGDIVLDVLEAIEIVKVPPYADSDNQNRTCQLHNTPYSNSGKHTVHDTFVFHNARTTGCPLHDPRAADCHS